MISSGVLTGAPAIVQNGRFRDPKGFGLVLLMAPPQADDMLAELVFPGVAGFPALAPVKDEIFQLVQGELARYVVVQAHQLYQVFTG